MNQTLYCRLIARWRHGFVLLRVRALIQPVVKGPAGLLLSDPRVAADLVQDNSQQNVPINKQLGENNRHYRADVVLHIKDDAKTQNRKAQSNC